MFSVCRLASGHLSAHLLFVFLILISLSSTTYAQTQPSGTLTTTSPCYLPGPESTTRCTVNVNITIKNTPGGCLWNTIPLSLYHVKVDLPGVAHGVGQQRLHVFWNYALIQLFQQIQKQAVKLDY